MLPSYVILSVEDSPLQTAPKRRPAGRGALRTQLHALRESARARSSLRNALYGVAEYLALPCIMLVATPFLLRHLGVVQFGLWMLGSAAVTSSNLISTGFGDAALKYAAMYRGKDNVARLEQILGVNLTINLVL